MSDGQDQIPKVKINWDKTNNALWHSSCSMGDFGSPIKVLRDDPDSTVVQCVQCGVKGIIPVGMKQGVNWIDQSFEDSGS